MDEETSQNALLKDVMKTKHDILETTKLLSGALHELKENINETFKDTKLWIRNTMAFSNDILSKSLSVMEKSKEEIMTLKELVEIHVDFINLQLEDTSKNIGIKILEDGNEFLSLLKWLMAHVTKVSDNCLELLRISKEIESIIPNFFGKIEATMNLLEHVNHTIDQYIPQFLKKSMEKNDEFNKMLDDLQGAVKNIQDTIQKSKLESTEVKEMQVSTAETLMKYFCFVKENIPQPSQFAEDYNNYKLLQSRNELEMKISLEEFRTKTNDFRKECIMTKELNIFLEKFDFIEKSIAETMEKLDNEGATAVGEFEIKCQEELDKSITFEEKFKQSLEMTEKCEEMLKKFEELMNLKDLQQHFHH